MLDATGMKPVFTRLEQAETYLRNVLAEIGDLTPEEAEKAARVFKRERLAKRDVAGGIYRFTHGAFLERDVVRRAAGIDV